jgi:hypothetical protein
MQAQVAQPYNETYIDYWRRNVSDQDPPDTEILFVGTKPSNGSPIHDRWWLTAGSGLRMGTSFRSIGTSADAELSELTSEVAASFEVEVNRLLRRELKEFKGEKLSYLSFNLD